MLAVDRRIALKTPEQETVLNLWTTSNSGNTYRSAQLTILNQLGQEAVYLTGNETVGGRLSLKMYGAQNEVYINSLSGLQIYNDLGNSSLWVGADGSGNGIFYLNHKSNGSRVQAFVGNTGGGILYVNDNQTNNTIKLWGQGGLIECNHVKSTGSVVEVVDTAFNSGNKTFNNDSYSSITVIAKVTGTSSYNITTIPLMFLESSDKRFCISDELNYVVFKAKLDNGVITITWESSNGSGSSIEKVYANY